MKCELQGCEVQPGHMMIEVIEKQQRVRLCLPCFHQIGAMTFPSIKYLRVTTGGAEYETSTASVGDTWEEAEPIATSDGPVPTSDAWEEHVRRQRAQAKRK